MSAENSSISRSPRERVVHWGWAHHTAREINRTQCFTGTRKQLFMLRKAELNIMNRADPSLWMVAHLRLFLHVFITKKNKHQRGKMHSTIRHAAITLCTLRWNSFWVLIKKTSKVTTWMQCDAAWCVTDKVRHLHLTWLQFEWWRPRSREQTLSLRRQMRRIMSCLDERWFEAQHAMYSQFRSVASLSEPGPFLKAVAIWGCLSPPGWAGAPGQVWGPRLTGRPAADRRWRESPGRTCC